MSQKERPSPPRKGEDRLVDRFHRQITYLRISVTDRCNMRCVYCMPGQPISRLSHDEILRYEEILRIVRTAVALGVRKVRVTGGDPLVRRGIGGFLRSLSGISGLEEVTLTTNGLLLNEHLETILSAGIRRLNISLDTLKPERFRDITGRDEWARVWAAIGKAHRMGFSPIKLNVVVLRGINDDELQDLAALSLQWPFHIRFIECMPMGSGVASHGPPVTIDEMKVQVAGLGDWTQLQSHPNDGPAERYRMEGAPGEIGFIGAISHHFCHRCNRLRLTASGGLRPCLLADHQFDLKSLIRAGGTDDEIRKLFLEAVRSKREHHAVAAGERTSGQMSAIGG
ncbi:MAG: GTP 3',8-cyclase MoaA [Desulfobacteraceae bacterium]|jgi:GTP 3',8-cyclase|nr:GTP 3',8-cyclase MoaA [Desulfobacteraceae bacterium]